MLAEWLNSLLRTIGGAPPAVIYSVLGAFAALENLVPPVPADVVALFGALLAGRGRASPALVFLVVWGCNVASALLVYGLGRRYGAGFFAHPWGHALLRPKQLDGLRGFYQRRGLVVIFVSRFLPMFRAVVPVFAGVSRIGFWSAAAPIALASAAWYGLIVYVGATLGRNWQQLLGALSAAGRWLWVAAALAAAGVAWWWWRGR